MTGDELGTYVQRRLAENGLTVPADRAAELYDYITEARDVLRQAFAVTAPVVVRSIVTLEQDAANDRLYNFPEGTADPYRVTRTYDNGNGEDLDPAAALNRDAGTYEWRTIRQLRLADDAELEGVPEVEVILHQGAITAATAEADVGLPTTCHRAVGKFAAVLALTADEESDAGIATRLFERELAQLEAIYGDYDANSGLSFRQAVMAGIGHQHGDTLY